MYYICVYVLCVCTPPPPEKEAIIIFTNKRFDVKGREKWQWCIYLFLLVFKNSFVNLF